MKTPTKASFSEGYSEDGTCRALGRSDQGVAEELDMAGGGEGRRYIQERSLEFDGGEKGTLADYNR